MVSLAGHSKLIDDIPLSFGKYKGQTPDEISEFDPSYIVYIWDTLNIKVSSKVLYNYCIKQDQ